MNRLGYHVGSTLMLFGAFAAGAVIHNAFIKGTFTLTSPPAVFGIIAGGILIGIGHWLEKRYKEDALPTSENEPEDEATEEFDEEMAPFEMEQLEKYSQDDSR